MTALNYEAIAEALPLEAVKAFARIDTDDQDELVAALTYAAVAQIELETGHLFGIREVTETFAAFEAVRLFAAPVVELTSVSYRGPDGDPDEFDLAGMRVLAGTRPARVTPLVSTWPSIAGVADAVQITFQAGHEPDEVPPTLITAAKMMIADLYAQRESFAPGTISEVPLSLPVSTLLRPFRVFAV